MKVNPILFNAVMVQAILDGKKTMTRRVIKPQPPEWAGDLVFLAGSGRWRARHPSTVGAPSAASPEFRCPYGGPGDRLWVRETWYSVKENDHLKPSEMSHGPTTEQHWGYVAGSYNRWSGLVGESGKPQWAGRTRASIHMPRWASRITLEVTRVKVERVQEITEADVFAEGCNLQHPPDPETLPVPAEYGSWHIPLFIGLWDGLNAKRGYGWEINPWVWVVSFRVLETKARGGSAC
jgi:hypothetical protein